MNPNDLVLLTNDDGYAAAGINATRAALLAAGLNVVVVAPEGNHTAGSHRITFSRRVALRKREEGVFSCDGTPADCVRVAVLSGVIPRPALVVTGMNHGANAGEDIHYSGTVSAAVEAAMLGIPALATSQDADGADVPFLGVNAPEEFTGASTVAEVAKWMLRTELPTASLLNLNFPLGFEAGEPVRWARLGRRTWAEAEGVVLSTEGDETIVDPWSVPPVGVPDEHTDFAVLFRGEASANLLRASGGLHDAYDIHGEWLRGVDAPGLFAEHAL